MRKTRSSRRSTNAALYPEPLNHKTNMKKLLHLTLASTLILTGCAGENMAGDEQGNSVPFVTKSLSTGSYGVGNYDDYLQQHQQPVLVSSSEP